MSRVIRRPRAALAVLGMVALLFSGPAAATGARAHVEIASPIFGLATAPDGSILIADSGQGVLSMRKGALTLAVPLPGVDDVGAIGNGSFFALTGIGDPESDEDDDTRARLWRVSNGHVAELADLRAFEFAANPDGGDKDSNPFDLAILDGWGTLVADAGGNSVLVVSPRGIIDWVATLPEELSSTANLKEIVGCPDAPAQFVGFCFLPDMLPTQAVATSVALGPDGAAYVSELRGFPGPVEQSKIWRIAPGSHHAVCGIDPRCTVVADGFTSIVDLNFGPDGTLYVTEIDEASFMAIELGIGSLGGTVNACAWDGEFPLDCSEVVADHLPIPTATTVAGDGTVYVARWALVPGLAEVVPLP
jgi:hypothetical protein